MTEIRTTAMWNSCGWEKPALFIGIIGKIKQYFTQKYPQQRWMEHQVYLASCRRDQAQWIWFSFMLILNDTIISEIIMNRDLTEINKWFSQKYVLKIWWPCLPGHKRTTKGLYDMHSGQFKSSCRINTPEFWGVHLMWKL